MAKVLAWGTVYAIVFFVGGFCIEYPVEFWAHYIKGVSVNIPFIPCGISAIVLGWLWKPYFPMIMTGIAIITWILSYVL